MLLAKKTAGIAAAALTLLVVCASAVEPLFTKDGLALSGYDAVAYFTESRPVKGSAQFEHEWGGARWRFATAANREAFAKSPEKYAPRYGGYCAYAVSRNYTASADPEAWKVVEGKLYLNYDKTVRGLWEKELPEAIRSADRNWPAVLTRPAPEATK
jgi:YHS domain-containing protein